MQLEAHGSRGRSYNSFNNSIRILLHWRPKLDDLKSSLIQ